MSYISPNGYIRCEQQLAIQCRAKQKACINECQTANLEDKGSCNAEKCFILHQQCSNNDLQCDTSNKQVTAEELQGHKFCSPEDTGCNVIPPDVVERVECDFDNNYCQKEQKSAPSTCPTCESKRYVCVNECKQQRVTMDSPSLTSSSFPPCSIRKCFEDADICHLQKCKLQKADLFEADEIAEGSTKLQREQEQKARQELEKEAALDEALRQEQSACGDGQMQKGEQCEQGGKGCKDCKCKAGFFAQQPPSTDCASARPAPCSFTKSGCMFGDNQVVPKMVPRGSLSPIFLEY